MVLNKIHNLYFVTYSIYALDEYHPLYLSNC